MSQLAETVIKRHNPSVWGTNLGGRIILIVEHMRNKLAQIIPSSGYLFHYRQDKTTVLIS